MLLDANLLLFAEDESSPFHDQACAWVTAALNGDVRVGLPWPSLLTFVRIRTHARTYAEPLTGEEAWSRVEDWLAAPAAWVPAPTDRHAAVLGSLVRRYHLSANAIPDAHLAALDQPASSLTTSCRVAVDTKPKPAEPTSDATFAYRH